jgi:hypothetical protein
MHRSDQPSLPAAKRPGDGEPTKARAARRGSPRRRRAKLELPDVPVVCDAAQVTAGPSAGAENRNETASQDAAEDRVRRIVEAAYT